MRNIVCDKLKASLIVIFNYITKVLATSVHAASPYFLVTRDEAPAAADSAPDRNLTLGPCTWIVNHKCPDDDNIRIYLFTRRNANDRQRIHIDETWEKSNLSTSFFNPADPVKIIIHGYNSDMFLSSLIDMKDGEFYNILQSLNRYSTSFVYNVISIERKENLINLYTCEDRSSTFKIIQILC